MTVISDKQVNLSFIKNSIFTLGMYFWQLYNILFLTDFAKYHNAELTLLRVSGLIIILSSFMILDIKKFNVRYLFFIMFCVFLLLNNWKIALQSSWFDLIIIVFAGANIDFDFFLKRFLAFSVIVYGSIVTLALLKIIPNDMVIIGLARVRYGLDFSWPSYIAHELVTITAAFIWVFKEKANKFILLLLFIINIFVYRLTDTKFPFIIVLCSILAFFVIKKVRFGNRIKKIVHVFISVLPGILTFLIYRLSLNSSNHPALDVLFSQRLSLGNQAINQYPIKMFGQPVIVNVQKSIIQNYFTIDSSYLRYLVCFGLISTLLIVLIMSISIFKILNNKDLFIALVLAIVLIEGFSDPWLFNAGYTPFIILLMSRAFFKVDKKIESNEGMSL